MAESSGEFNWNSFFLRQQDVHHLRQWKRLHKWLAAVELPWCRSLRPQACQNVRPPIGVRKQYCSDTDHHEGGYNDYSQRPTHITNKRWASANDVLGNQEGWNEKREIHKMVERTVDRVGVTDAPA